MMRTPSAAHQMTHGVDLNQIGLQPNAQHQREGNWASILEKSEAPERRGVWGAGRPRGPSAGSLYGEYRRYPRHSLRNNSGSLAMLAAIRRASSCVISLVAARRPGSSSK
jgi:hypothetical protein